MKEKFTRREIMSHRIFPPLFCFEALTESGQCERKKATINQDQCQMLMYTDANQNKSLINKTVLYISKFTQNFPLYFFAAESETKNLIQNKKKLGKFLRRCKRELEFCDFTRNSRFFQPTFNVIQCSI